MSHSLRLKKLFADVNDFCVSVCACVMAHFRVRLHSRKCVSKEKQSEVFAERNYLCMEEGGGGAYFHGLVLNQ